MTSIPTWQQHADEGEEANHRHVVEHYTAHDAARVLWCVGNREHGYSPGSFFEALILVALKADRANLVRLSKGGWSVLAAVWDFRYGFGENALLDKVGAPR